LQVGNRTTSLPLLANLFIFGTAAIAKSFI
jgi:hypothetical protein